MVARLPPSCGKPPPRKLPSPGSVRRPQLQHLLLQTALIPLSQHILPQPPRHQGGPSNSCQASKPLTHSQGQPTNPKQPQLQPHQLQLQQQPPGKQPAPCQAFLPLQLHYTACTQHSNPSQLSTLPPLSQLPRVSSPPLPHSPHRLHWQMTGRASWGAPL